MSNDLKEITYCEVCKNSDMKSVLDLGLHPLCDDLISEGSKNISKEYPIEILYCSNCYTAHQRYQVIKESLFPENYHYRARFTADVLNGMKELVNKCKDLTKDENSKTVLDIGCNDGSLLNYFSSDGFKTIGVEPTGASFDAKKNGHNIYNDFFSIEVARDIIKKYGKPDFITFTNVFAHIDDLESLISSLKYLMSNSTILVIENHYLGAIINKSQFDTFYHEHPRTYSLRSFEYISDSLNANLFKVEFPKRYGGNIRVFISKEKSKIPQIQSVNEDIFNKEFLELGKKIKTWRLNKKKKIDNLYEKYGKLPAKAFPGRAAILVKLLGLDDSKISCVYEKPGSLKIGHYVPGTRIPIKSDDELFKNKQNNRMPIINLAWHIEEEIKNYLASNAYTGDVINIVDIEDLK